MLNAKYTVCKHNSPLIIYVRKQCIIKIDCNHINILMRSEFINDAMNNFKAESIFVMSAVLAFHTMLNFSTLSTVIFQLLVHDDKRTINYFW